MAGAVLRDGVDTVLLEAVLRLFSLCWWWAWRRLLSEEELLLKPCWGEAAARGGRCCCWPEEKAVNLAAQAPALAMAAMLPGATDGACSWGGACWLAVVAVGPSKQEGTSPAGSPAQPARTAGAAGAVAAAASELPPAGPTAGGKSPDPLRCHCCATCSAGVSMDLHSHKHQK